MKFSEIIDQASALLQRKGRITYRSLQLEFDLEPIQILIAEIPQARSKLHTQQIEQRKDDLGS